MSASFMLQVKAPASPWRRLPPRAIFAIISFSFIKFHRAVHSNTQYISNTLIVNPIMPPSRPPWSKSSSPSIKLGTATNFDTALLNPILDAQNVVGHFSKCHDNELIKNLFVGFCHCFLVIVASSCCCCCFSSAPRPHHTSNNTH